MYNLDVLGNDNFFVGEKGWLVHNCSVTDYVAGLKTWNTPTTTASGAYEIAYTAEPPKERSLYKVS